jgi:tetratricopeptide (TPR) repeat protein
MLDRKSQIAIEYCYRFREAHPTSNILWVHASTAERFQQAYKDIARRGRFSGWDDAARNPLELVSDWLLRDNVWLMVVDNADDKEVFFEDAGNATVPLATYLPQTSRLGRILITSRNVDAASRLVSTAESIIDVPFMDEEDAMALLYKKLPNDESSHEERVEFIKLLDRLPLAITQAAAYIGVRRTRMTIARYADFLRKNEIILLEDMGDLRRDPTIPNSVLMTWQISFDQINKENRPAAELLSLMSVFDRQGIPESLLRDEAVDDLAFENCLGPLQEFSLVTQDEGGQIFQMHRLVQVAVKSWLVRHGEIDQWKQNALRSIAGTLPWGEYQQWGAWEILLPQTQVALDYLYQDRENQLLLATILERTADYFTFRGKYDLAYERCQRAYEIRVDVCSEDDILIAGSLRRLAILKQRLAHDVPKDLDEAEAMARRALTICERVSDKDRLGILMAQNALAFILIDNGNDTKVDEAMKLFQSVLESGKPTLGAEHHTTLHAMDGLAKVYVCRHRFQEAEKLYREKLDIRLRVNGENNPWTIATMYQLANFLTDLAKYGEAEHFAKRALNTDHRLRRR